MKRLFTGFAMVLAVGGTTLSLAVPQLVFAADSCDKGFLGFPAWYRGVTDGECNITVAGGDIGKFIWHIVLNCIDIALVAVAYLAIFFILYAGFTLIVSTGNSDAIAKSRQTILNAVIGLAISIASMAVVNVIFGII